MPSLPPFLPATDTLPPGRFPLTWEEVESELVKSERFAGSATRAEIFNEWEFHYAAVEAVLGAVSRIWLAGSFVSGKIDPSDADVTYLIPHDVYDAHASDSDDADYLDNLATRDWCVGQGMRVDAYILRLPGTTHFGDLGVTGAMALGDREVFYKLGLYDEIWQRCRATLDGSGTDSRRGYVEVLL
ncbi:hypothetical protein [Streptomyces sp. NBC_01481]|uniref:DUF6932 family protein n=1 Tax=Streptomyces sp. NBC_01481 TaxID=2975869 RepID=UPI002252CA54|nr:hypothetical protein [Streptomyces sp. NBC_01481]MCX4584993.1 hypothetical protein [Streptomyces sp. NBC_01481]